jgi:prevent-host-death family protein
MKKTTYSIQAGEFKAKCLHLMDVVSQKHLSFTITKHGKPIARLVPIDETPVSTFGCLQGSVTIQGDIISPLDVTWEENE